MGLDDRLQGLQDLGDGLDELGLLGVLRLHLFDDVVDVAQRNLLYAERARGGATMHLRLRAAL